MYRLYDTLHVEKRLHVYVASITSVGTTHVRDVQCNCHM